METNIPTFLIVEQNSQQKSQPEKQIQQGIGFRLLHE